MIYYAMCFVRLFNHSSWNFAIAQNPGNPRNLVFSAHSANSARSAKSRAIPAQSSDLFSNCVIDLDNWRLITKFSDFFSCEIFLKVTFGSNLMNFMFLIHYLLKEANV